MKALASLFTASGAMFATATSVMAAQPTDKGLWHQTPASDMMARIEWFDAYTFWFITPITLFVLALLIWVMVRYNAKANPKPSTFTHNTTIEVVWTVVPVIILFAIAIPSFQLLNDQLLPEEKPTMTIKAVGQAWYWDYEYQDDSELSFSSNILGAEAIAGSKEAAQEERVEAGKTDLAQYPNLLAVDNELVVPVGEMIRLLVTADAGGVIHSFALPAFGLKLDAIPGRVNETWFKANKEGLYYGQCSELCGINHAYMPIGIRVVSRDEFDLWQQQAEESLEQANKDLMASIEEKRNLRLANNQ